ncbi:putative nuclear localization protein NPL6 [Diplocarpon rosae]|nr:putative nuclear localization protein NPL6 [Diplocarpon rosae]
MDSGLPPHAAKVRLFGLAGKLAPMHRGGEAEVTSIRLLLADRPEGDHIAVVIDAGIAMPGLPGWGIQIQGLTTLLRSKGTRNEQLRVARQAHNPKRYGYISTTPSSRDRVSSMGKRPGRAAAKNAAAALKNTPQYDDGEDETMPDASGSEAGSAQDVEDEIPEDGDGTPAVESDAEEAPSTPVPEPVLRKKRLGRPPKNKPADWDAPEPESSDLPKRRGRGGFRGGGRWAKRGGPSHVTQQPIDKEGNMMDVIDDEVMLPEDPEGETKVDKMGNLQDGREYRCRTFTILGRGARLYMLSTEPARCVGFRDSYLFFTKHKRLFKIIIDDEEKRDLIERQLIPHSYKGRAIGIVTARSVFREFGAQIIVGGKRIVDDYEVTKLRAEGAIEGELADPTDQFKQGEDYNKNQYVAWHGASSVYHSGVPTVPQQAGKPPAVKRKIMINDMNWMLEHARSASQFNADLAVQRRDVLKGIYDPHTNIVHYPKHMQPTHARWEQIDDHEVAAKEGLSNGFAEAGEGSMFTPVKPIYSKNFMIVDTVYESAPASDLGVPGPDGDFHDIGFNGLSRISDDIKAELPEECRLALEKALEKEMQWKNKWGSESQSGHRKAPVIDKGVVFAESSTSTIQSSSFTVRLKSSRPSYSAPGFQLLPTISNHSQLHPPRCLPEMMHSSRLYVPCIIHPFILLAGISLWYNPCGSAASVEQSSNRPKNDANEMKCLAQADLSPLHYRHGTIIVRGGKVIGQGFNCYRPGFDGGALKSGALPSSSHNGPAIAQLKQRLKSKPKSTSKMQNQPDVGTFTPFESMGCGHNSNVALSMHSEMMAIRSALSLSSGAQACQTSARSAKCFEKPCFKLPGDSKKRKARARGLKAYAKAACEEAASTSTGNSSGGKFSLQESRFEPGASQPGESARGKQVQRQGGERGVSEQGSERGRGGEHVETCRQTPGQEDIVKQLRGWVSPSSEITTRPQPLQILITKNKPSSKPTAAARTKDLRLKGSDLYVARLGNSNRTPPSVPRPQSNCAAMADPPPPPTESKSPPSSLYDELSPRSRSTSPSSSMLKHDLETLPRPEIRASRPCYRCVTAMHSVGIKRVFWTTQGGEWEGAKVRDLVDALEVGIEDDGTADEQGRGTGPENKGVFVTKHEVLMLKRAMGF